MTLLQTLFSFCAEVHLDRPARNTDWMIGIYFLIDGDELGYIGQSLDVQKRVLHHTRRTRFFERHPDEGISSRHAYPFDRAFWMRLPADQLDDFEETLIRALRPKYNTHAPRGCTRGAAILEAMGLSEFAA